MKSMIVAACVLIARPLAAQDDHFGTRLDWGNVEVSLYPTHALGVQLEVAAESSHSLRVGHTMSGGFIPDSVFPWLDVAALVIDPRDRPRDRSQAIVTPALVSSAGDSILLLRRSTGTKWEKRVVVMIEGPHIGADRFALLVLPSEAKALLAGVLREASLSGFDRDSAEIASRSDTAASIPEVSADQPPTLVRAGQVHHPDPSRRGRVVMKFVIDTSGHADPATIRVVTADHMIFVDPARAVILGSLFTPARVHGTPVRAMVQQVINFGY